MPDQLENWGSYSSYCAAYYEVKFNIETWKKNGFGKRDGVQHF